MNLKHFYYRGYFDGRIKLAQPKKDSPERKKNEEVNEKAFRLKNTQLTSTEHISPFSPARFQKIGVIQELRLKVQNPGLLPGIGYPHEVGYPGEFKLGFGFDHVSGLPVLPGSSVKGVLRSVFPQVKFDPEKPMRWTKNPDELQRAKANYILSLLERLPLQIPADMKADQGMLLAHAVELAIFCGRDVSDFFAEGEKKWPLRPMSKHDVCLDALPVKFAKNHLGEDQLLGRDALTPHGDNPLKNPIPLPFLKVMPGVEFGFWFRLHDTKIGESLTITADHKRRIFGEILCTVGAGAKTNVGYGQFEAEEARDRLKKSADQRMAQSANVGSITMSFPTQPASPATVKMTKLPFTKSLQRSKVIGEVVSAAGENPVRFKIINVEGFEDERAVKVPDSLLPKFKITTLFNLTVTESRPEKNILHVKIEDFIPRT